jgi:hypothetical protein
MSVISRQPDHKATAPSNSAYDVCRILAICADTRILSTRSSFYTFLQFEPFGFHSRKSEKLSRISDFRSRQVGLQAFREVWASRRECR